ncbi:MAG: peptidase family protein [Thermoleophilia bacterium]|nr:peptidase family protein [Thermoleophilia bacterium]
MNVPPSNPASGPVSPRPEILTYDKQSAGKFDFLTPGDLVRVNDQPRTGDAAVDAAHENAQVVADFLRIVLGRDSIDGAGMPISSSVHDRFNEDNGPP